MKCIAHKLRGNQGSSMILALFLMLVAVMVSATILTSAATAARSVFYGADRQQSFLTVSSAATVLRDTILDSGGRYEKKITYVCRDPEFNEEINPPKEKLTPVSGCYGGELQTLVDDLINQNAASVTRKYGVLVDGFEPVEMVLELKKDDPTQVIRKKFTQQDPGTELKCTLTATFSNVLDGPIANPDIPYREPETPVQIVVVLHGTLKQTFHASKVNREYVLEITNRLTWDPKQIQVQKSIQEERTP